MSDMFWWYFFPREPLGLLQAAADAIVLVCFQVRAAVLRHRAVRLNKLMIALPLEEKPLVGLRLIRTILRPIRPILRPIRRILRPIR